MPKIVGAILAAGSASRFGGPKQLAELGGERLIDIALRVLTESAVEDIGVVVGCYESEIEEHIQQTCYGHKAINLVRNEHWMEGIASSIRSATAYAQSKSATHLLLITCDQPYVTKELLNELCDSAIKTFGGEDKIAASSYGDSLGIPAIFPAKFYPHLSELSGDKGAKSIIKESGNATAIEFPKGTFDIDTNEQLEEILAQEKSPKKAIQP
ncbi:MAG TPA: nucleotidyltransferase family protein [Drouetiella sp.]